MSEILIVLAPGFEEIEAITIIDILRRAEISVTVAGTDNLEVTGSHDITVRSDILLEEADTDSFKMLILPGGQPGTNNLKKNQSILNLIKEYRNNGKFIAAICAAPTVLEKAGILANVRVTSYPSEKSAFIGREYLESKVVRDGKIITSRGVGTALDFALELVEILRDGDVRTDLAKKILWNKI